MVKANAKFWMMAALALTLLLIIAVICVLTKTPPKDRIVPYAVKVPVPVLRRQPEYREPPYKQYNPPQYQQMGLLLGGTETLPLYGRRAQGYSDRWNYYTTTPGNQMYSLPVAHEDRDCTEDLGCREFYGNEDVSVTGKTDPYKTKIYRTTFY
jgi:hypothetical protein